MQALRLGPVSAALVGKYSCELCGVKNAEQQLPLRGPAEEIKAYMDAVVRAFMMHHLLRFPGCQATKFTEIKIPVPKDGGRIGDPA